MKVSQLITSLQSVQATHGDLDVHFWNGIEYKITSVQHVAANKSSNLAPATVPHLFQSERLVIIGKLLNEP